MRAVQVIVVDVFREQALEMSFVYRNDVIQQVSPTAFDPMLGNAVLPGTFKRGQHRIHPIGLRHTVVYSATAYVVSAQVTSITGPINNSIRQMCGIVLDHVMR